MKSEIKLSNAIDERIVSFITSQTNLTIAVVENKLPYCANCFYVYSEKGNALIFKSKRSTLHIKMALNNSNVAGTIVADSLDKTRIQGVQYSGNIVHANAVCSEIDLNDYYLKFPWALVIPGELWVVKLKSIKFKDFSFSFRNKLEWKLC